MEATANNDPLQKNITKTYKKGSPSVANAIEQEAKTIAKNLDLSDRINTAAKR